MASLLKQALDQLDRKLEDIADTPGARLSSLVFTLVADGQVIHEFSAGRAFIAPEAEATDTGTEVTHANLVDRPAKPDTLYRIASISKPVTTMAALSLQEEDRLDLDRDVSDYLGWPLRNPAFPDSPISCAMLLSHLSSLRDGEVYNMPLGAQLRDFFEPGGRGWEDGAHFADPSKLLAAASQTTVATGPVPDLAPGRYFAYCNLGYGVVATVIERITGERYDRYVKRRILEPLGLEASFNVNLLSDGAFARLAPIYRTGRGGSYNPAGNWQAQVDDYRGKRPALPCPALAGKTAADLEAYVPGTNGTLFSPQGGLRASVRDLSRLLRLFQGKGKDRGSLEGRPILNAESLDLMRHSRWRFDPASPNGDCYNGMTRECGLGLMHTTDTRDQFGGDRLLAEGGPCLWGHHADAYGLLGGLMFHPDEGYGFAYLIGGTAEDPEKLRGRHSSYFIWEEGIQAVALGCLMS